MLKLADCVRFKDAADQLAITADLNGGGLCFGVYSAHRKPGASAYTILRCLLGTDDTYIGPRGEFTELRQSVLFLVIAMSAEDILEVVQQHYYD